MPEKLVKVMVTKEELEQLEKIGGTATKALRKLINLGLKSKVMQNSVGRFMEDCVVVTGNNKDKELLKDIYNCYLDYCEDKKIRSFTKQAMRAYMEDSNYKVSYRSSCGNKSYFFGIQLL